jgi:hypothetical protein
VLVFNVAAAVARDQEFVPFWAGHSRGPELVDGGHEAIPPA